MILLLFSSRTVGANQEIDRAQVKQDDLSDLSVSLVELREAGLLPPELEREAQ
jgi:hypothetical protein